MSFRLSYVSLIVFVCLVFGVVITSATTLHTYTATCGNCGLESSHRSFGSFYFPFFNDMDFCPAAMVLNRQALRVCPQCGYLGGEDFEKELTPKMRAVFESPAFAIPDKDSDLPEGVVVFLRSAMLNEAAGHWFRAGTDTIDAVWICDPGFERGEAELKNGRERRKTEKERKHWLKEKAEWEEDVRGGSSRDAPKEPKTYVSERLPEVNPKLKAVARKLRNQALIRLERALKEKDSPQREPFMLPYLLAELHRRASNFDKASWYLTIAVKTCREDSGKQSRNEFELMMRLLDLQEKLIMEKNSDRHSMESIAPDADLD